MIQHKHFICVACLTLLLSSCTVLSENGIGDVIYQNDSLYLCRHSVVQKIDLSDNSLEEFPIPCGRLFVSQRGQLWMIALSWQVEFFDGQCWKDIDIPQVGYVDYLSETSDGLIWFSSSLLSYYDSSVDRSTVVVPAIAISPATPAPVPGEWFVSLPSRGRIGPVFEASDGAIWYNQQFDGLVRWDRTTDQKQVWGPNDGFRGFVPVPAKFIQAHDGTIWVGTDTGAYRFYNNAWQTWMFPGENQSFHREEDDFRVVDMIEDHNGNIWIAFNRAGVAMWNGSSWQSVGNFEFPAGPQSIFEDASGVVWISSLQHNLTKYWQGTAKEYPGIHLFDLIETPAHWLFGNDGKRLYLYDSGTDQWHPYQQTR